MSCFKNKDSLPDRGTRSVLKVRTIAKTTNIGFLLLKCNGLSLFAGLTSDEEEPPSTSHDESGDRSDRWPLVEVSAAKCMYVHYKVRKNSVDGPTSVTVLSEPSSK